MSRLDPQPYVPTNPLDAAACAIDPIAFMGNWPNRKMKARLTVARALRALRDTRCEDMDADLIWRQYVDDILKDAPPEVD
jgi:hypothetical protein